MPFEDKLQTIISSMDDGLGLLLTRLLIAIILLGGVFGYFAYDQFRGLNDAGAMEMSQLGRNLSEGRGFTTRCLRPFDIGYLENRGFDLTEGEMPDIRTAPLYPALLGACFRLVRPSFDVGAGWGMHAPEVKVIIPLAGLLVLATALVMFGMARMLFDWRVATLAVAMFAVTESVLAFAISGTEWLLATFLVTSAFGLAQLTIALRHGRLLYALLTAFLSGLFCGLALLSAYALLVIIPGALLMLWVGLKRQRWLVILVFVVGVCITVLPWFARNQALSGSPIGLAAYSAIEDSVLFEDDLLERRADISIRRSTLPGVMKLKVMDNLHQMHEHSAFPIYGGIVFCLFVAAVFHRFESDDANRAKWCTVLTLPLLHFMAALSGTSQMLLVAFPLVLIFGTGFYFVLEDRMEFVDVQIKRAIALALILAVSGPAMLTLSGVPRTNPYPPYAPPFIGYVSHVIDSEETLCTDIPWATSWYGNRRSLLLPEHPKSLVAMHENGWKIGGIYLTSRTGGRPYYPDLLEGRDQSWLPLLDRSVPEGFPWPYGIAIPPGSRSQILLTDRERW